MGFIRKTRKMLIQDVSSVESCIMGGSRIFLVLQDISNTEDIIPVFQVFLHGAPQPNLQMLVNQPEKENGSETWFSFYTPPQQNIKNLPEEAMLRFTVQDRQTGAVAENWSYFYYSEHKDGEGQ